MGNWRLAERQERADSAPTVAASGRTGVGAKAVIALQIDGALSFYWTSQWNKEQEARPE
jgi:hypothetical protein